MLIEIKRVDGILIYSGEHDSVARAIEHCVRSGVNLCEANLYGANLPAGFRVCVACFGGWQITVYPDKTQIGCQIHGNESWLAWTPNDVAHMHATARDWWADHGEAVKSLIRNVMQKDTSNACNA